MTRKESYMRLIIICAILWQSCLYAECTKNVESVKQGQSITAKCDGFFVKHELMNELKNNDEILKLKEKEIKNLESISFKQEQMTNFYKDRSIHLTQELNKSETRSFWKGIGMFTLGVLVTGAASYAVIKAL
jgi:hypothetical protein